MKKNILLLALLSLVWVFNPGSYAQTTAYDFNMDDCNGQMHHLFSELDSGNVVILEYFMRSCSPCIDAGHVLEAMLLNLRAKYGKKVRFYQFAFTNSYTCAQVKDWVTTNGFTSVPFDSGGVQVAYYGGMGMPTTAVVAGKDHKVLFTNSGFSDDDTTIMASSIRAFFDSTLTSIPSTPSIISSVSFYPNPVATKLSISLNSQKSGMLQLTLTNLEGQKIADLTNENIKAGIWNKMILLPQLANGFYFLRGEIDKEIFTRKITILQK
jgi:hypothetical protein